MHAANDAVVMRFGGSTLGGAKGVGTGMHWLLRHLGTLLDLPPQHVLTKHSELT